MNRRSEELLRICQQRHHRTIDLTQDRLKRLMARLGDPHLQLPPTVHVAGTNGKGSTLAFLFAILTQAGLRVHLSTSPHLLSFHERIILNGHPIEEEELCHVLDHVLRVNGDDKMTFFELTQAACFLAFSRTPCDVVLLETGLGGRADATNIIQTPALSVITPIGMDHQDFLGHTLEKIAAEKAGILKPHCPYIMAPQVHQAGQVIEKVALDCGAPLVDHYRMDVKNGVGKFFWRAQQLVCIENIALKGPHQWDNLTTALACAHVLREKFFPQIKPQHMALGASQARWPGRFVRLNPGPWTRAFGPQKNLWIDGAHNVHAAHALKEAIKQVQDQKPWCAVVGILKNRDPIDIIKPLQGAVDHVIGVTFSTQSHGANQIAKAAQACNMSSYACESLDLVPEQLRACPLSHGVIFGSLYFVAEVLKRHGEN